VVAFVNGYSADFASVYSVVVGICILVLIFAFCVVGLFERLFAFVLSCLRLLLCYNFWRVKVEFDILLKEYKKIINLLLAIT